MKHYMIGNTDLWKIINEDIGEVAGVYKLHCLRDEDNLHYIPIPRLLGTDLDGILYIGSSGCLRDRVTSLRKALSGAAKKHGFSDPGAHACGHKYINFKIQNTFPYERLCVTLYPNRDSAKTEVEILNKYEKEYGEAPPFNEGRPKAKWASG